VIGNAEDGFITLYKVVVKSVNDKTGAFSKREDVMFLNKYNEGPMQLYGYTLFLRERNSESGASAFISIIKMPGNDFGVATKNIRWIHTIPNFAAMSQLLRDCPQAKAYLDDNYTNVGAFKLNFPRRIENEVQAVILENKKEYDALKYDQKLIARRAIMEKVQLRFYEEINNKYIEFCGNVLQ